MAWFDKLKQRGDVLHQNHSNSAENSEQTMNDVMRELQGAMAEAQVRITQQTATVQQLQDQVEELRGLADRRHEQAQLATLQDDVNVARRALAEEANYRQQAEAVEQVWKQAADTLQQLRLQMETLKGQETAMEAKRSELIARKETATFAKSLADVQSGIDKRGRSFDKMQDEVQRLELEAAAHQEIAGMTGPIGLGTNVSPKVATSPDDASVHGAGRDASTVDDLLRQLQQELGKHNSTD